MSERTPASQLAWAALNVELMRATEDEAQIMLHEECAGPARKTHVLRIHSRINALRAARERRELTGGSYGKMS